MGCGQNCLKQNSLKETKSQSLQSLEQNDLENTTQVNAISLQSQPIIQYQLILQETRPPKKPAIHSQDNSDNDEINFENNEFVIEHFSAIRCINHNYTQSSEQTSKNIMKHLNKDSHYQLYNSKKKKQHRNKSKTKKKIDMQYLEDQF